MNQSNQRASISTRAIYVVVMTIIVLTGCATSSGSNVQKVAQPEFTVKWLPPCSTNIGDPYFSVEVFDDGRVRYVGGEEARERGERQLELSREQAQALINSAREMRYGSKKATAQMPDRPLPEYCLEVSEHKKGKTIVTKAPGIEKRMQPVINAVGALVEKNKWVCPSRGTVRIGPNKLGSIGFCGHEENVSVVGMTTYDKSSCIMNSIEVYRDVIHYTAKSFLGEAGVSRNLVSLLTDEYYVINEGKFTQILNTAKTLVDPLDPEQQYIGDYGSSKPEAVLLLKQAIDKVVSIKLAELPEGTPVCRTGWEHRPTFSLDYYYGPPLKQ